VDLNGRFLILRVGEHRLALADRKIAAGAKCPGDLGILLIAGGEVQRA
jgi:hypothetical protein